MVTLAEELPFAAAVETDQLGVICSSCFSSEGKKSRCIGCKVASYCDKNCQKKDWIDHKHECSFLKNYSPNIPSGKARLMARIAMKLKRPEANEPAFNGRVYDNLMDHCGEIKKDAERMKVFVVYSQILREYMGDKVPDSDLLMSIYGKIEMNTFGISSGNQNCGHGLYLGLSVHDHSCVPDVRVDFHGNKASLHSPDPNKIYSKDLTVAYTEILCSNRDRRKKLQSDYYFTCTCTRCSDPTLDFLYNSARSTCCPDSYCLLDPEAKELTCNKCGSISRITVKEAVTANEEVRAFGDENPSKVGPDMAYHLQTLIKAYEKFSKILSPMNLNLFLLNGKLAQTAVGLESASSGPTTVFNNDIVESVGKSPVCRKHIEHLFPACKRSFSEILITQKLLGSGKRIEPNELEYDPNAAHHLVIVGSCSEPVLLQNPLYHTDVVSIDNFCRRLFDSFMCESQNIFVYGKKEEFQKVKKQ